MYSSKKWIIEVSQIKLSKQKQIKIQSYFPVPKDICTIPHKEDDYPSQN